MAKKRTKTPAKPRAYILKKHFPTFYDKPVFAVILLLALIVVFWTLGR